MKHILLRRSINGILVLCMSAALLTGCNNKEIAFTTGLSKKEIMKIDGQAFSKDEANIILLNLQREYEGLFGQEAYSKKIADKTMSEYIKTQAVEQMSQINGLAALAEKNQLKLSEQDTENVKKACEDYMSNVDKNIAHKLGINKEAVEGIYTKYCLANRFYQEKINSITTEISDDEARIISIQYMFFSTKTKDSEGKTIDISSDARNELNSKILGAIERVNAGENFEKVALDVSDDDTVFVSIGRGEWVEEAEDAAFNLTNEQVSDMVETKDGIYVIKCVSNYDEQKTLENKQKIYKENCENLLNKEYDTYISAVLTEFNDEVWKNTKLKTDENIINLPDLFAVYRNYITLPSVELNK